jgi:ABC-type multidrug transport system ATPase subunit
MIQLREVSKRYGPRRGRGVDAVREISFTVPRGECWAVVGPNGAGKTTLFGLMLGFLRPTAGEVEIDGDEPRRYLRSHGAGYLPERFMLPSEWPVREALHAFARLERLGADAGRVADEALERCGLTAHSEKTFGELSHGLRQRVGIAQATLADRQLFVLDEPTEGLDPLWRIQLRDAIATLRARGATILLASHDLAEVERMANHVVVMDRGVVREGFATRPVEERRTYALRLEADTERVMEIFPGAERHTSDGGAVYHVAVADTAELSNRLAALLATGAVITTLQPVAEPLEERVRRALGDAESP